MRMHAKKLAAVAKQHGAGWQLTAPMPGVFRATVRAGSSVDADAALGTLEVLGAMHEVVAPPNAAGYVTTVEGRAVQFGDVLVELAPGANTIATKKTAAATTTASGLVFRAPTSGRFYGRSSPDKPAFVNAGDEISRGATVCLLEVMKTFHRVHFGGTDVPERARVKSVLVKDGDDVNAGDALLALEAI